MNYLETAEAIAREAGALLMDHFGRVSFQLKGDFDLVTEADRASEKLVVTQLKKHFPAHSIIAEEGGGHVYYQRKWIDEEPKEAEALFTCTPANASVQAVSGRQGWRGRMRGRRRGHQRRLLAFGSGSRRRGRRGRRRQRGPEIFDGLRFPLETIEICEVAHRGGRRGRDVPVRDRDRRPARRDVPDQLAPRAAQPDPDPAVRDPQVDAAETVHER